MRLQSTLCAFQSACWCSFEQYPRDLHDAQSLVAFSPHDGSPHSTVEVPSIVRVNGAGFDRSIFPSLANGGVMGNGYGEWDWVS
jgi:hypothetical protein